VPADWPATNAASLAGVVERALVSRDDQRAPIAALQLTEYQRREDYLEAMLGRRAGNPIAPIAADWKSLLEVAITRAGGTLDPENPRHARACEEQARALHCLTARRLTVLAVPSHRSRAETPLDRNQDRTVAVSA